MSAILLVDDDKMERHLLVRLLNRKFDCTIFEAEDGRSALDILSKNQNGKIKVVVLDLNMPVMGGLETLHIIKDRYPMLPVIILTGSKMRADVDHALNAGAIDFISKPYDADRILVSLKNAIRMSVLNKELTDIKRDKEGCYGFENIIGYDQGLSNQTKLARKAALSDIPVLICGETGTGKELFAKAIHGQSHRAGKPFIAVNCGAIPSQLIESTLFGHEKGAFTGATEKFAGKFREANGGTIFLDEVGELSLDAQVKLLRVIQQREVEPVGAAKPIPVNVRVISATNRNLIEETKVGRFREDLLFRLNVLNLEIPPLRQRTQDNDALVEHFLDYYCAHNGILTKTIKPKALKLLSDFSWPGNVRQLENIIHCAIAVSDSNVLEVDDFQNLLEPKYKNGAKDLNFSHGTTETMFHIIRDDGRIKTMDEIEKDVMAHVLKLCDGNKTQAAKMLGIAKSTFYKRLGHIH